MATRACVRLRLRQAAAANLIQMEHVVKRFYAEVACDQEILNTLAKQLYEEGKDNLVVADVQSYLIQYKRDPQGALDGIQSWLESLRPPTRGPPASEVAPFTPSKQLPAYELLMPQQSVRSLLHMLDMILT